jgi:hypothetical protein
MISAKDIRIKTRELLERLNPSTINVINKSEIPKKIEGLSPDCKIVLSSEKYWIYPNDFYMKMLEFIKMGTLQKNAARQIKDADDYSLTFMSLARQWHGYIKGLIKKENSENGPKSSQLLIGSACPVGFCHGSLFNGSDSAFCFYLTKDGVTYIEPATMQIIQIAKSPKLSFVYI